MYRQRRIYLFIAILTVGLFAGFQGWRTLLTNYSVEVVGLSGLQMGVLQSVREIPGFLALFVISLLAYFSEHRLAVWSVLIMGAAIALTGASETYIWLTIMTVVMSFGFHYFETLNQSLTLQYFSRVEAPLVFGRMRSISAATNIATGVVLLGLTAVLDYTACFALVGLFTVAMAIYALRLDPREPDTPMQERRYMVRREYWLFYVLTFLSGARRQIFIAFALFLMVQVAGYTIHEIAALFILNNVIQFFASPYIGHAINRFGERSVLSLEYATLLVVFCVYAFSTDKLLIAVAYVVDHLVFNFAIAIRTYFHKIAEPGHISPTTAVSFTINHIAAVIIPAVGGLVWLADYSLVFLGGAGLAFISLVFTQFIRIPPEDDAHVGPV